MQAFDDDGETSGTVSGWVMVHNVAPTISEFDEPLPFGRMLEPCSLWSTAIVPVTWILLSPVGIWIHSSIWTKKAVQMMIVTSRVPPSITSGLKPGLILQYSMSPMTMGSERHRWSISQFGDKQPVADIWVSELAPKAGEMFGLSGNLSTDTPSDQENLGVSMGFGHLRRYGW